MTTDEVFIILQKTYQLVYDGEWWNVTGFNEEECYLEHCEHGDETVVSLDELAKSNVDYYELKKIEISEIDNKNKIDPFENPIAAQIESVGKGHPYD